MNEIHERFERLEKENANLRQRLDAAGEEIHALQIDLGAAERKLAEQGAWFEREMKTAIASEGAEAHSRQTYQQEAFDLSKKLTAMTQERDSALAACAKMREALKAVSEALNEVAAYGDCQCDIPNGVMCPACLCALAERQS